MSYVNLKGNAVSHKIVPPTWQCYLDLQQAIYIDDNKNYKKNNKEKFH